VPGDAQCVRAQMAKQSMHTSQTESAAAEDDRVTHRSRGLSRPSAHAERDPDGAPPNAPPRHVNLWLAELAKRPGGSGCKLHSKCSKIGHFY